MSVLLVVNTAPYGSEGPYNAFRSPRRWPCATSTSRSSSWATPCTRRAPARTRAAPTPRSSTMLAELLEKGVDVQLLRHLLRDARPHRGPTSSRTSRVATIHDLAAATVRSDRVVSF